MIRRAGAAWVVAVLGLVAFEALAGDPSTEGPLDWEQGTEVPATAAPAAYVGWYVCKGCHFVQYLSWRDMPHAQAYTLLEPGAARETKVAAGLDPDKDYTADPGCLACHSTGHGEVGGFRDLKSTPHMSGVGCESCHGAGSNYVGQLMLKRYGFSHAEAREFGHISFVDHVAILEAEGLGRPETQAELDALVARRGLDGAFDSPEIVPLEQYDRYGYSPMGDPPPWARRYDGELFPLDPKSVRYCTESCHNERSPTHAVNGVKDLEENFEKYVKQRVHRRFGLKFLHW